MVNEIREDISRHIEIMGVIEQESKNILQAARARDISRVEFCLENRERMINGLRSYQMKIEQKTHLLDINELTPETMQFFKEWLGKLNAWVEGCQRFDEQIVNELEEEKTETTKQIASIFKNKQHHKGYNLNNVKK